MSDLQLGLACGVIIGACGILFLGLVAASLAEARRNAELDRTWERIKKGKR